MAVRIFSGIQPTGVPHLGNYLGALKYWVNMQSHSSQVLYSIVDYHAITVRQEPQVLRENVRKMAISLLACGIDTSKSILFQQSKVPAHCELSWILSCFTSSGQLQRMHQWKSKAGVEKEHSLLGLYAYPVLMASDILLYKTTAVPVGDDQMQHLELTRDIAKSFNKKFGEIFPIPEAYTGTNLLKSMLEKQSDELIVATPLDGAIVQGSFIDADDFFGRQYKKNTSSTSQQLQRFVDSPVSPDATEMLRCLDNAEVDVH